MGEPFDFNSPRFAFADGLSEPEPTWLDRIKTEQYRHRAPNWERKELAVSLREQGLTYEQIGRFFGVTANQGRALVVVGDRWLREHAEFLGSEETRLRAARRVASDFPGCCLTEHGNGETRDSAVSAARPIRLKTG